MATYVVLATFTDQGVKNAKDSPKRAPDELSATALNLSLTALGNIRTESLLAFSSADMLKIVATLL